MADALSRIVTNAVHSFGQGIDFSAMAATQQDDQEIDAYKTADSALSLQGISFGPTDTTLLCDTSTGQPRPIVPRSCFRKTVLDVVHGLSHPSIRATRKLNTDRYVWKGVRKEVAQWVKTCIACQESKVQQHTRAPPQVFEVPLRQFDHIHIDFVGPLPPSQGCTHLLTIVDLVGPLPPSQGCTHLLTIVDLVGPLPPSQGCTHLLTIVDLVGPLPPSQGCTHLLTIVDQFTRWPGAIPLKGTDTETCASFPLDCSIWHAVGFDL